MQAFSLYSPDCSSEIDPWEMKQALTSFGKHVTDGDLYDMLRIQGKVHNEDMTINFREFSNMCWKQFFEPVAIDDEVMAMIRSRPPTPSSRRTPNHSAPCHAGILRRAVLRAPAEHPGYEKLAPFPAAGRHPLSDHWVLSALYCQSCQVKDVQQAFVILGGGQDGSGEVSVAKLKTFTESTELTIDVDKFVAEVDDDGSGLVDYKEFCQLFKDRTGDTNLHTPGGEHWLRQESESLTKPPPKTPPPLSVDPAISPIRPQRSKTSVSNEGVKDAAGASVADVSSNTGSPLATHTSEAPHTAVSGISTAPVAPKANRGGDKKLFRGAGKHPVYLANNSIVTCRRGWRFSQLRKNMPGSEGYNTYAVRTLEFTDLDKIVRMRQRGAEFTVKEQAAQRMDQRPSSELRHAKIMRSSGSRPGTSMGLMSGNFSDVKPSSISPVRPITSMGGRSRASPGGALAPLRPTTSLGASRNSSSKRILSHERQMSSLGRRRPATSAGAAMRWASMESLLGGDDKLSILDLGGGEGAVGRERSGMSAGPSPLSLRGRSKSAMGNSGPKPWQENMKKPPMALSTEELLKRAATIGLYSGREVVKDMGRDMGAGISFFDG